MTSIQDIRQQYPQYNDMSDDDLATALHQKFYSDMPVNTVKSSLGVKPTEGYGEGLIDQALQGLMLNGSDEFGAGVMTARDKLHAMSAGKPYDIGQNYGSNLKFLRNQISSFQQQNPKASIAAQVGGGILPMFIPGLGPEAAETTMGRVGQGALSGGKYGAITGFNSGQDGFLNRIENAAPSALFAMAAGGLLPVAGAALSGIKNKLMSAIGSKVGSSMAKDAEPETIALAQKAQNLGVPVYASQMSNSRLANAVDSTLKYVPGSGRLPMERTQQAAFTQAVSNTIGENSPKITQAVMNNAKSRIGAVYDNVLSNTNLPVGPDLVQKLTSIADEVNQVLGPNEAGLVNGQIKNILLKAQQNNGVLDGNTLKAITTRGTPLTRLANNAQDNNVQHYAGQVKDTLNQAIQDSRNPADAAAFKTANQQYKNLKTIEPLAVKAMGGNISPSLLLQQVAKSYPNFAYNGAGDIGDLARIGQQFIKDKVGDSGTPIRGLAQVLTGLGTTAAGGLMTTAKTFGTAPFVGRAVNSVLNGPAAKAAIMGMDQTSQLPQQLIARRPLSPYLSVPLTSSLTNGNQ